jgi:hypothetical protein
MREKQVVQEGGKPFCRSARCPRILCSSSAAAGGKTGTSGTPQSPEREKLVVYVFLTKPYSRIDGNIK